jgi:O-antigen/teichoic acid export membrane protein
VDAVLLMAGRSSASLANTAVAFALNVGLNLLLIPRWGIAGAALAWLAALSARNVVALVLVARSVRLLPFGTGARVVAVAALGVLAAVEIAVRMVLGPGPVGLAVGTALGGCAYAAVLWRRRRAVELPALAAALRRRGRTAVPVSQVTVSRLGSS